MKKVITAIFCLIMAVGTSLAQNSKTITGYVVDKNGNPIAGAEVMAAGGGATTLTDSDGSFNLEVHPLLKKVTISYPGMKEKGISVEKKTNLIVTMKPERKRLGFISAFTGVGYVSEHINFDESNDYSGKYLSFGDFGLMGGSLGNWGGYGKACFSVVTGMGSVTGGVTKRVGKSPFLYFGAGACFGWTGGIAADFGAIFKIGSHFNVLTGLNYCYGWGSDEYQNIISLNIGLGYVF